MQNIRREPNEDGVCLLIFDRANSAANIFDRATLQELGDHLDAIASSEPRARGLVLTSAKDSIFIAGADLHGIRKMNAEELREFLALGQTVFNKVAALPIPTVAAIHGAALGGGYELSLACDWRVASPDSCTKIGLPETRLGILPAWGGSTRLPRLIGVPKALDIILGGKTPSAKHALKLGMIDEVAPRGHLRHAAFTWLLKGKRPHSLAHSAPVNAIVDVVIGRHVRHDVEAKTHGHYPAVKKAMDVVMRGAADWNEEESFKREREAIEELLAADSTRQLLNLFFLEERAKRRAIPAVEGTTPVIERTAVIGAGVMGAGIAQWLSARGLDVILRDIDAARVAAGMASAAAAYVSAVKRRVFSEREARAGLARISPAASEVPLTRVDLVIEAAVEKMDVKKTIFQRLDEQVREDALLATNTSALSITELAASTKHPHRVIGIHFFNPVHRMQLVEVVTGRDTAPETAQRALRFVQRIGKLPVLVKDSPGFLVNRILLPYLTEAARLFERGTPAEEIDAAMLDFGMPMGPLRLIDEVGVDIAADVATTLSSAFPGRMSVPEILGKLAASGSLGRKTGKGFYLHEKDGKPVVNREAAPPLNTPIPRDELARRMALLMVNEAALCLQEGIAETPGDIDFAMVMGTGFAPFRGGPLRYADTVGVRKVADDLSRLAGNVGPHYQPCALLTDMAQNAKRFYED
jgi:3-hydroxyacyl-CoA dehydrogenase/enoyl-CoA hydratase/3-hydroxybutyryl-CoA epimerase